MGDGDTKITVDGQLLYKSGDLATALFAADIPVKFGDHELVLSIRDTVFSSVYSLSVDGVVIDGPDTAHQPIATLNEKQEFQGGLVLLFIIAPLLYIVGGDRFCVGPIRTDHLAAGLAILGVWMLTACLFKRRQPGS